MQNERDHDEVTYLTVDDVARRFRVSRPLVRKWARSGELASLKLPGRNSEHRFRLEDVDAFEADHYQPAVAS